MKKGFTPTPDKNNQEKIIFTYRENQVWGFTLIEAVVYFAIFIVAASVIVLLTINLNRNYIRSRIKSQVLTEGEKVLNAIIAEIATAKSVYTPTSCFGVSDAKTICSGSKRQLSLETLISLPSQENSTFVDFYLDNQKIYLKRESQTVQALTSDRIKITNLTFDYYNPSTNSVSVAVKLTAGFNTSDPQKTFQVNLASSASIRTY